MAGVALKPVVRVTEQANELTKDIDTSDVPDIVRLLRLSDEQMFKGFDGLPSLRSAEQLQALMCFTALVTETLASETGLVVCTGSGTSGRLAFFAARAMNELLVSSGQQPRFHYLIAGGDHALIKAKVWPPGLFFF